ncbi:plasmid and phage DNA primase [Orbus hercynius]|uniref:Plasmid and phage DNA primase n=1 Tax=Orbus hercynius TaxID=593135 RepID=A0A495RBF9_9GAMM|nr:primase-helicase zinc-binding domain-containing protein [Orbus hercynius]RKS84671.1 plasmid and phage DNA primase [Orbus hercynius]
MIIDSVINQAVGKWDSIYQSLNIDVFPKNKHKPCPVCGGRDRFRYDDRNSKGDFICNQCGSGDGINLIERIYHCNAKEAINKVAECLNVSSNHNKTTEKTAVNNIQDNPVCKKVEYLLSIAVMGQSEYLTRKGITFNLPLLDGGKIIAPLLNIHNEYTGAQFIEPNGNKQLMKGTNKKGSFIAVCGKLLTLNGVRPKLGQPINEDFSTITTRAREDIGLQLKSAREVIICEGLATGLTLREFNQDKLIIIALDAGNLIHVAKAIRETNSTVKIVIGADNDAGNNVNTGLNKAIEALECVGGYLAIPDTHYNCDWNDYSAKYGIDETSKAFTQAMREIGLKSEPESNKRVNKGNERLQSNTPANKRADILVSSYNGNLAYNRSIKEAYYLTGKYWRRLAEFELLDKLISIYEDNNIDYSIDNVERVTRLALLKSPLIKEQKQGYIYFDNGAYCVNDMTFTPHSKANYNTSTNGITYHKSAVTKNLVSGAPLFYNYLSKATNQDNNKLMGALAILYIILANRHEWHYFIEVTGAGGTGKSTFSEIARLLVGEVNTADCDIKELERKASTRTALIDKTLLILSDQSQYQGEGDLLKKLSSGDKIDVDPKYKQAHSFKPMAVILAVNNSPMIFRGSDSGIDRRHIRLVFDTVIPASERDPHLLDKIKKELPFIINYLLETFSDDEETVKQLELLKKSDEAEGIKRSNSPIYDFYCYLEIIDTPDGLGIGQKTDNIMRFDPKKFLFHGYDAYYRAMIGGQPRISVPNFKNQLKEIIKSMGQEYSERTLNGSAKTNIIYSSEAETTEWLNEKELYRVNVEISKQNH